MKPCADCRWPYTCADTGCYMTHSDIQEDEAMPAPNPKAARAVADGKAPLDYLEPCALAPEARVMKSGADKYGRRNFRDSEILATTYVGAILRHTVAFAAGEDADPDSGESHLAHIRACCAVVLSAQDAGTFRDDRHEKESRASSAPTGSAPILTAEYARGVDELVEELRAAATLFRGRGPTGTPVKRRCCLGDDEPVTSYCFAHCGAGSGPVEYRDCGPSHHGTPYEEGKL